MFEILFNGLLILVAIVGGIAIFIAGALHISSQARASTEQHEPND